MRFVSRMCCVVVATTVAGVLAVPATAEILFSDSFESGDLSYTQHEIKWMYQQSTQVSKDVAATGSNALKFTFQGVPLGEDSFAEQRITLPARGEYWFKYKLYIPNNYVHRVDTHSNNKFLALYHTPYLKVNPGFQVNFSLQANGSGGSHLEIHHYNAGVEGPVYIVARDFITAADAGKWMALVAHVKAPTSATSKDGIMRMWKNGVQAVNVTDLPSWGGVGKNFIDQAYFLGWSNSGFAQTTFMYIDDVLIADSPLINLQPNPPTDVIVR